MVRAIALAVALLVPSLATASDGGASDLLVKGAQAEKVFDGGCVFTEGVAAAPDGSIYFSDITVTSLCKDAKGIFPAAGHIWRFDPRTGKATVFRSPSGMSNGLEFDAAGDLLVAEGADHGGRRITRTDMTTGKSYILSGLYGGRPYNSPNDLVLDARGRVYFTDPRYAGYEPLEQLVEAVYRIDPDGAVVRLTSRARKPNGVAISPDQKHLYVVDGDSGGETFDTPVLERDHRGRLFVYDLQADGALANERILIDWGSRESGDGIAVDVDGNLYIAMKGPAPGVAIFAPDGRELARLPVAGRSPQAVGFGRGADANLLYVAADNAIYRIRVKKAGFRP